MSSDVRQIEQQVRNASEAGISARLLQGVWDPADKKTSVADKKSGGLAATIMEMADEGLYGKAYAQELRGASKVEQETKIVDTKVPSVFPSANIVGGENGYIAFGAQNEIAEKRDDNSSKFLNFVDNRLAA